MTVKNRQRWRDNRPSQPNVNTPQPRVAIPDIYPRAVIPAKAGIQRRQATLSLPALAFNSASA